MDSFSTYSTSIKGDCLDATNQDLGEVGEIFVKQELYERNLASSIRMPHPRSRGLSCPDYYGIIPKVRTKSPFWNYFGIPVDQEGKIVSEEVAICTLCEYHISSRGGSTSNLSAHLKNYHPVQYAGIRKSTQAVLTITPSTSSAPSNPQDDSTSLSDDDNKVMSSLSEVPPPAKKHRKMLECTPTASDKACTSSVAKFIATAMQPYNIVECQAFVDMLKAMNPCYELPGRQYFSENAIPKMYLETKEKLLKLLESVKSNQISITTEAWTSLNAIPFIAVTAHFLNKWEMQSVCLSCFEEDNTAENSKEILQEKLSEWNINLNEVCSCTTDKGGSIVMALDSLQIPCFGHVVNIGINNAMKLPILNRALSKLKRLQNSFSHSWKLSRDLGKAQKLMQLKLNKLPSVSLTHWGSTLKLCVRFLENQIPISKVLKDHPTKRYLQLDGHEIASLEVFVECTKLLHDITKNLSGDNYTTGSSVIPLLRKIKKDLEIKAEDSQLKKNIKGEIASVLEEQYYSLPELMNTLTLCTVCDPRFRLAYTLDQNKAEQLILEEMLTLNFNGEEKAPGVEKKEKYGLEKLLESDDSEEEEFASIKAEAELKNYISMPKVPLNSSPLIWWKSHAQSFPCIEALAMRYLAIQGTSAPPERVFSFAGNVITKNRTSLLPKNAEMLVFLAQNKDYV